MNASVPTRVLVVEDDDADVAFLMDSLVQTEGSPFEVRHVARIADAKELLADDSFDAVLLDLGLPDSVGLATFESLRDDAESIPILVLTSLEDEAIGTQAVKLGAQDYLIKSEIRQALLGRLIRFAIERQRLQQTLEKLQAEDLRSRELRSFDRLSKQPGGTTQTARLYDGEGLAKAYPRQFDELSERYQTVLETALDHLMYVDAESYSDDLRLLGRDLGYLYAGPRDVVELHSRALKLKLSGAPVKKQKALVEEGRLLLVELMGNLADYYRRYYRGPSRPEIPGG